MSVTYGFKDLPLADRGRDWDSAAAEERVRSGRVQRTRRTRSTATHMCGTTRTRRRTSRPTSCWVADVIGGRLYAVPRAVMAAAAVMQGSRGGAALPPGDVDRVKSHLAKYYVKWGEKAPWDR